MYKATKIFFTVGAIFSRGSAISSTQTDNTLRHGPLRHGDMGYEVPFSGVFLSGTPLPQLRLEKGCKQVTEALTLALDMTNCRPHGHYLDNVNSNTKVQKTTVTTTSPLNNGGGCSTHTLEKFDPRSDAVSFKFKLNKIDTWLDKKRQICRKYSKELDAIVRCPKEASWSKHTYYVYVIETPEGTRDDLQEFLKQKGIATNIHYKFPTHKTKAFQKFSHNLERTEYVCENILSLPCYHTLPEHHQNYIINSVKEFYAN